MTQKQKFRGERNAPEYEYVGISFFGDDKQDLITIMNKHKLPYSSMTHFIRTAINTQLNSHGIDFQITER